MFSPWFLILPLVLVTVSVSGIVVLVVVSSKERHALTKALRKFLIAFLTFFPVASLVCLPLGYYGATSTGPSSRLQKDMIARAAFGSGKDGGWYIIYPVVAKKNGPQYLFCMTDGKVSRFDGHFLSESALQDHKLVSTMVLFGATVTGGVLANEGKAFFKNLVIPDKTTDATSYGREAGIVLGAISGFTLGYWLGSGPPSLLSDEVVKELNKPETWRCAKLRMLEELIINDDSLDTRPPKNQSLDWTREKVESEIIGLLDRVSGITYQITGEDADKAHSIGLAFRHVCPSIERRTSDLQRIANRGFSLKVQRFRNIGPEDKKNDGSLVFELE